MDEVYGICVVKLTETENATSTRSSKCNKKEFHKIQGDRIFDRGSGLTIIQFSTDFCKRKCHVWVLNLNS